MKNLHKTVTLLLAVGLIYVLIHDSAPQGNIAFGQAGTSDIGRYQVRNVTITTTTFWGQGKASDEEQKLLIRLDTSTGKIVRWYSTITVDKNEKFLNSKDHWLEWYGQESR